MTSARISAMCAGAALGAMAIAMTPQGTAHADQVAYLVNVTVRPGYNFANAQQAIDYGQGVCEKVAAGHTYAQIVGDLKADFGTSDAYQASYLIAQSVNELCPEQIWALRNSAAGYRPDAS